MYITFYFRDIYLGTHSIWTLPLLLWMQLWLLNFSTCDQPWDLWCVGFFLNHIKLVNLIPEYPLPFEKKIMKHLHTSYTPPKTLPSLICSTLKFEWGTPRTWKIMLMSEYRKHITVLHKMFLFYKNNRQINLSKETALITYQNNWYWKKTLIHLLFQILINFT